MIVTGDPLPAVTALTATERQAHDRAKVETLRGHAARLADDLPATFRDHVVKVMGRDRTASVLARVLLADRAAARVAVRADSVVLVRAGQLEARVEPLPAAIVLAHGAMEGLAAPNIRRRPGVPLCALSRERSTATS